MSKKQLIIDNAIELFAKQGIETTSVQEITDRCGISKGAFYLSFKSKDELIISIIRHFMSDVISDIDQVVRGKHLPDQKLFSFYNFLFTYFHSQRSFAQIFIMEQLQNINQELLLIFKAYDQEFSQLIGQLLDELYGDLIKETKYDLLLCVKGFIKTYSECLFLQDLPIDIEQLAASLVEKTNILARHAKIVYLSDSFTKIVSISDYATISFEQLEIHIEQLINELAGDLDDELEQDSLVILLNELRKATPNYTITTGMLRNIEDHPRCKWITFLIRKVLQNRAAT